MEFKHLVKSDDALLCERQFMERFTPPNKTPIVDYYDKRTVHTYSDAQVSAIRIPNVIFPVL